MNTRSQARKKNTENHRIETSERERVKKERVTRRKICHTSIELGNSSFKTPAIVKWLTIKFQSNYKRAWSHLHLFSALTLFLPLTTASLFLSFYRIVTFNWNWWLPSYCVCNVAAHTILSRISLFSFVCPAENHIKWASVWNLFILLLVNSCMFFSLCIHSKWKTLSLTDPVDSIGFNWIRSMSAITL